MLFRLVITPWCLSLAYVWYRLRCLQVQSILFKGWSGGDLSSPPHGKTEEASFCADFNLIMNGTFNGIKFAGQMVPLLPHLP